MTSYGVHLCSKLTERDLLVRDLMEMWGLYGFEHRTMLQRYHELIELREQMGIKPLLRVKQAILKDFPENGFLDRKTKEEAEEFLSDLTMSEMKYLLRLIDDYVYSMPRRTIKGRIEDFEYELRHKDDEKSQFGMLAEDC